jgi:hypothetical protein
VEDPEYIKHAANGRGNAWKKLATLLIDLGRTRLSLGHMLSHESSRQNARRNFKLWTYSDASYMVHISDRIVNFRICEISI